ncbi:MAG TPA: hypothetical protein VHH88_08545 [Verrucomicrobiae bacterium]|nr:hypothetical protein [Verrucomicrobiae bacterium]
MKRENIVTWMLTGYMAMSVWTIKTVVDLKVQVAQLDARISSLSAESQTWPFPEIAKTKN